MPSPARAILLTPRDHDILAALERSPLTASQLLTLSQTFVLPFTDERRVRERMQLLVAAGRVRRWFYATAGRGALGYYTLSPLGYRLLHGDDDHYFPKRAFGPVGIARQFHALKLADFIVHTTIAAYHAGLRMTGFYRENACCLRLAEECLFPDCAFQLVTQTGFHFSYFVEIDNSTEVIRSDHDRDSWERKLRLYDQFQATTPQRFRVLIVTTRSSERARHILDAANTMLSNPQRSLVYGIGLSEYLARPDALTSACFRDHVGRRRALVWMPKPFFRSTEEAPCQAAPVPCYPLPPVAVSATVA